MTKKDVFIKSIKAHPIITALIVVLVAVILGAGIWVESIYSQIHSDIPIVEKPSEPVSIASELPDEPQEVSEQVIYEQEQHKAEIYNILLVGMDARKGQTTSRSDSIVLVTYNVDTQTVKLTSFMRDSWVELPEKGWQRINAATAYGCLSTRSTITLTWISKIMLLLNSTSSETSLT